MLGSVTLALLALAPLRGRAEEPLTHVADVRNLPRAEAARGRMVQVRGVVTIAFQPTFDGFVVDDGTGIYVGVTDARRAGITPDVPARLKAGDVVEIEGRTTPGHFAPMILAERVRPVGREPLPEPRERTLDELLTGKWECQRVALRGVAQALVTRTDRPAPIHELEIATEGGHCIARLPVETAERLADD